MWVVVGGKESDPPYRIYNFRPDRCHQNLFEILKNYKGTFHSDRYGAYVTMSKKEEVTWDARDVGGRFFMFFLGIQYHRIGCTFG